MGVSGTASATKDGVLFDGSRTEFIHVSDGTANTLLLGERPPSTDLAFGWWYAGVGQDLRGALDSHMGAAERNMFDISTCPPGPDSFRSGDLLNQCDTYHFWSLHAGGANFAFCDGSVRFLPYSAADILPALATRAGGEAVTLPD